MSYNKYYELFDRDDNRYYYFIDNNGKHVGINKFLFKEVSLDLLRDIRIDKILNYLM